MTGASPRTLPGFLAWAADYMGTAAFWAALGTLALAGALALVLPRRTLAPTLIRVLPLALSSLFLLALGLLPLPDPATFDCRWPEKRIVLIPFEWLGDNIAEIRRIGTLEGALTHRSMVAAVMNVVLFLLPGMALFALTDRVRLAALYGFCLSLSIEIPQLTGLFGYYDCPYRHFDTSDLISNTAGVALGLLLARRLFGRRPAHSRGGGGA